MKLGIDASRAFSSQPTGIETYSYHVIKHLRPLVPGDWTVVLYTRKGKVPDFPLPKNWCVKQIQMPLLWTQLGLSYVLSRDPVDILFLPAHTIPFIHPKKTIVVVHGLEYERCPQAYSLKDRLFLRLFTRLSCHWAKHVITPSHATKNDLINLYRVKADQITVIPEGALDLSNTSSVSEFPRISQKPFFLFVGRIEKRKNVVSIIKAFNSFRTHSRESYQLVLAGSPGYGYKEILCVKNQSPYQKDILFLGFVTRKQKVFLYKHCVAFLFLSTCEGFGLPILEAQSLGAPVIASDMDVFREVAGSGAAFVDYCNIELIAVCMSTISQDINYRDNLVKNGRKNAHVYVWQKSAQKIVEQIISEA